MQLTVTKSRHGYRIITNSTRKHPFLIHLAELVKVSNKISPVKVGVYSISGGEFSMRKRVYSFVADRVEYMGKKKFYKFMRGEATLKGKKPWTKSLELSKAAEEDLNEILQLQEWR